jgi:transcription antitermination factor NusG
MLSQANELKWHVVYTMPNTERNVAMRISDMGIESYLPLHKVIRQWSDRRKKMEVPLFPNYVFVKVEEMRRGHLYSVKDLVKFVSIEKKPVTIREKEILTIKQVLQNDLDVATEEYFQEGMSVKITRGQFAGVEGIVVKACGNTRLVVQLDSLMKAFSFNISIKAEDAAATLKPHSKHSGLSVVDNSIR